MTHLAEIFLTSKIVERIVADFTGTAKAEDIPHPDVCIISRSGEKVAFCPHCYAPRGGLMSLPRLDQRSAAQGVPEVQPATSIKGYERCAACAMEGYVCCSASISGKRSELFAGYGRP